MDSIEIGHKELCDVLFSSKVINVDILLSYFKQKYNASEELEESFRIKVSRYFMPSFNKRWIKALAIKEKRKEKFLELNKDWVNLSLNFTTKSLSDNSRKTKSFNECSEKTKKRRIDELRESVSGENVDLITSLQVVDTETAVDLVRKGLKIDLENTEADILKNNNVIPFTDDEALAMFLDLSLTKRTYEALREKLKGKNADILPPYKHITSAKVKCYPGNSAIEITETKASIKLQDLLNHTASRLLSTKTVTPPIETNKLKMISKYGGDGTSGFNCYKQRFEHSESSDESIFLMSLVPLRLECANETSCSSIIWENSRPCSPKHCLPIMFEYAKETKDKIILEFNLIKKQVKKLKTSKIKIDDKVYYVEHELMCTMVDGKVCQHLTGTSSAANCVICGAKPTQMNELSQVLKRQENVEAFAFGLQVLHMWIRVMECVLNISYRLLIKKSRCTTEEDKFIREKRKSEIKEEIKNQLGLIVDTPKQGAGSSNDGNTARRFFANYEVISDITGFDKDLLKKLYIILQTLASGRPICTKAFRAFTLETAELYVKKYDWYYMPSSLHKLLIHGSKIIDSLIVPIGQLSEEAQEAKNKDFKRCRQNNTRKTSRIETNTDLIHYLLISSDLYISSLRKVYTKLENPLLPEAKDLLLNRDDDD